MLIQQTSYCSFDCRKKVKAGSDDIRIHVVSQFVAYGAAYRPVSVHMLTPPKHQRSASELDHGGKKVASTVHPLTAKDFHPVMKKCLYLKLSLFV